jgi:acyl dehydratase
MGRVGGRIMNQGDYIVSNQLCISKERILKYAKMSNDFNPIHVDEGFAETTQFRSIIAHGMLSLNLLWKLITDTFGEDSLNNLNLDIRFKKPVKVNETIQAVIYIDKIKAFSMNPDISEFHLVVSINDSKNEEVIKGTAKLLLEGGVRV